MSRRSRLTSADFRAYPFSEGCLAGGRERKRAFPVLCVISRRPSARSQQVDRSSLIDRTPNEEEEGYRRRLSVGARYGSTCQYLDGKSKRAERAQLFLLNAKTQNENSTRNPGSRTRRPLRRYYWRSMPIPRQPTRQRQMVLPLPRPGRRVPDKPATWQRRTREDERGR